eukprot:scaffold235057_cov15-Tisochrysis_lutea.AAC.1
MLEAFRHVHAPIDRVTHALSGSNSGDSGSNVQQQQQQITHLHKLSERHWPEVRDKQPGTQPLSYL